jgi:AraC-like DNA-binding protein
MPPVTVANVTPRGVIDFCSSRGVSSDGLLEAAGIPPALVTVPGSRVSAEQAFSLWDAAEKATGDPQLPEHVANFLPFGSYRIADYLLVTGATPRDALQKFIRSFPLVNTAFQLHLKSSRTGTHLELHSPYEAEGPSRFYVEFIFAMIFARLRLAAGVHWRPREVWFAHPSPPDAPAFHPTFGCPVQFEAPLNQMVLDRDFAEASLPSGDAMLSEILDHYAQSLLKDSGKDDFLSDVRKVLGDGLSRGDVRIETTARKLALSDRSLQRQLQERGTSYRDELDRFRRDLALDLLPVTQIHEIARLLQFSELSSFYRAFRRWTGRTPQSYLRAGSS